MELGRGNACVVQILAKRLELRFVLDGEVNVRRMKIFRSAIRVGMFNGCMAGLNCLLREWDVAAADGVEVRLLRLENLKLGHDASFQWLNYKIYTGLEDWIRTNDANHSQRDQPRQVMLLGFGITWIATPLSR